MNDISLYKLPPQSIDAEESLLSACLIDPESLTDAIEILKPDCFYRSAHQKIFKAMMDLYAKKEPVDLVTLSNALKQTDELPEIGGATYLAKLVEEIPMAVNVKHYANIIRGKATLRQAIEKCNKITEQCFQDSADVVKIIDNAQKEILSIEVEDPNNKTYSTMPELLERGMDLLEERSKNPGKITGLCTGFSRFDFLTWGLQPSDLVLIAARPSAGKTSLALNIARNAVSENISTAIFSLEMSKQQLLYRLMSDMAKVNGQKFKSGLLENNDWTAITNSASIINDFPLFIDDSGGLSIKQIQRRVRNIYKKHGLGLVVIDYLQLVSGEGKTRDREISDISQGLKNIAKELNIPVIALSQLNRNLEQRSNKRPVLADLRDSGTLEQDADIIVFIYRDEMYDKDENNPNKGIAEINIAKQRNGPVGTIKLAYVNKYTSFYQLESNY